MKRFILVGSVILFSVVLLSVNVWAAGGEKATQAGLDAEAAERIAVAEDCGVLSFRGGVFLPLPWPSPTIPGRGKPQF